MALNCPEIVPRRPLRNETTAGLYFKVAMSDVGCPDASLSLISGA